jgi:signal transduction histidine kinase
VRSYVARGPTERRPIDLAAIVQESAALLATEARRQRVQLQLDVAPLARPPVADAVAVQQVLVNLLRNALESLKHDAGSPRNVSVAARQVQDFVEITVSDTGCGLSDEDQEHLFTPFYTSKPEGLGMGLPISKTIVEAHGGRIWAASNPDGGTTVGFSLPLGPAKD